jgi:cobalt-zinc-cadmium resistance protein CzcA
MERLVAFSLKNRFLILVLTVILLVVGFYSLTRLKIGTVPDITPNMVQIITRSPGLSAVEVERFVTFPVERAMSGLPGITRMRSVSRFGLSNISVFFEEGTDLYFARRLVMERLPDARAEIPQGFGSPEMAPISTGLGEILQFEVRGKGRSLQELRTILDWEIAPRLMTVPGVVEVNGWGGEMKSYQVELDIEKLTAYRLSLEQVFQALEDNNMDAGGAYIEHNGEAYAIRGEGLIRNLHDIDETVVAATTNGTPIRIHELARVRIAPMVRYGAVTRDGHEIVAGIIMMLMGENPQSVVTRVKERLAEIAPSLPPGVSVDPYYDRSYLIRNTIETAAHNLILGGILVIAVLLVILGDVRGGLIVASAIPLSMLFAFAAMVQLGIPGNLMSLGALDFGLIVDGSVVMVENFVRKLGERPEKNGDGRLSRMMEAAREVARPIFFGVGIIIVVYVPILALRGTEGKMFRPMAETVLLALVASLILAFTLIPVLSYYLLGTRKKEGHTWFYRAARWIYRPVLDRTLAWPKTTFSLAAIIFASSLVLAPRLGAVFIPRLNEGAFSLLDLRLPSVSLTEAIANTTRVEELLRESFPDEVETVVSRTGQAEVPTDPEGFETSDVYVMLTPRNRWTKARSQEELASRMAELLKKEVPGSFLSFGQPISERFDELIGGSRADVAIKLFGSDLKTLQETAQRVAAVVADVPGAADVRAEQTAGQPFVRVRVNRAAASRYGISARQVLDVLETVAGKTVGQIFEGEQRFDLQVRFAQKDRSNLQDIRDLTLSDSHGRRVPLGQVANVRVEPGAAQISRENNQRVLIISANVRGRDLAGFVREAQRAVTTRVKLPVGYWLEWSGQYEELQSASRRLALVVPLALLLIFVLLYYTFGSAKVTLLILINVPMAVTGGIFALYFRGLPFSISAGVGFIALFGIATLNGVVLLSYVLQLRAEGGDLTEAVRRAAEIRLRPVLMTALVASLGFIPMALSTSPGAEVQRPLATVVIGGLITSTALTLLVLPALYRWTEMRSLFRRERRIDPAPSDR